MVDDITPNAPAVGGCLRCRQLFLVSDSSSSCQFCGRPPDVQLPFAWRLAVAEDVELVGPGEPGEAAPETYGWVECPHCQGRVDLIINDSEISVAPPPPSLPAEPAVAEPPPGPAAAAPPADTPPPPAMAQDIFGNPIEGPPPPPASVEWTTEPHPGSVGEGQGAAAPSTASEEQPE